MKKGKKILLAEDDDAIAEITTTVLEDAGYIVICPASFENIVHALKIEKFSLVLLDGWLWGRDSAEVIKYITDVPIILLSAQQNVKELAEKIGAHDVLEKPFDIGDLLGKVERSIL